MINNNFASEGKKKDKDGKWAKYTPIIAGR